MSNFHGAGGLGYGAWADWHVVVTTHVMDVKSEIADFQIKPGTPGLTLLFQAENQRVYRVA